MRFAVLALALFAGACASTATQESASPAFNPAEAEFSRRPGNTAVRGQMFLRRNDGIVVYGAGSDAILMPRTAYSEAMIAKAFQGRKTRMEIQLFGANLLGNDMKPDPAFVAYFRRAKADGQGNFAFDGVPPGQYFVIGRVVWCAPSRYGCDQQGGDLLEHVTITPSDRTVQTILSGA